VNVPEQVGRLGNVFESRPAEDRVEGTVLRRKTSRFGEAKFEPGRERISHVLATGEVEERFRVRLDDVEADESRRRRTQEDAEVDDPVARPDVGDVLAVQLDAVSSQELDHLCRRVVEVLTKPARAFASFTNRLRSDADTARSRLGGLIDHAV